MAQYFKSTTCYTKSYEIIKYTALNTLCNIKYIFTKLKIFEKNNFIQLK